jgi:hypothetical protein
MLATFKTIGLVSALTAGVVTAYDLPQARDAAQPAGKTFYDRVLPSEPVDAPRATTVALTIPEHTGSVKQDGKGDALRGADTGCAAQTWPNISRDCVVSENGAPVRKPIRTITIEKRDSANSSTLVRLPAR